MRHPLAQVSFNPNPPPAKPPSAGMIAAWGALVLMTGGVLYMTLRGGPARPVSANRRPRRNRGDGKLGKIRAAVDGGRSSTLSAAGAPKRVIDVARSLPEGVFRVTSKGDVIVYRDREITNGVLTSTRIAASKSPSVQTWLVQVIRSGSGRKKAIPIRGYKRRGGRVDTVYRVEEA